MTQKAILYALVALVLITAVGIVALSVGGHDPDGKSLTQFLAFVSIIVMALLTLLRSEAAVDKAGEAKAQAAEAKVAAVESVAATVRGNEQVRQLKDEVRTSLADDAAGADGRPKGT